MGQASRDDNRVPTLLGVSSVNLSTPTLIAVNPTTHALLIDGASLYVTLDTRYAPISVTGTVSSVSVVTANGISGSVANSTTTPAITLTLGVISPTSVNGLTLSALTTGFTIAGGTTSKTLTVPLDATVSGNNTGDQDLSDYVPYTGATTDVDLGENSFKLQSILRTDDSVAIDFGLDTLNEGSGNAVLAWSSGIKILDSTSALGALFDTSLLADSDKTFTFPDASGTIALTQGNSIFQLPVSADPFPITGSSYWDEVNNRWYIYNADLTEWKYVALGGHDIRNNLSDLLDVNFETPLNNQVLKYDSTSGKWENSTGGAGGADWGEITGTLSAQTDLQGVLDGKANSLGDDDNYVTDTQLVVIGNTSGENTGDQTASDIGLGLVDNTADVDKPVSTAQQEAITAIDNNAAYKTIKSGAGSHIAAKVAGNYIFPPAGGVMAVGGTGTLYPQQVFYLTGADFPTINGVVTVLRVNGSVHCNDVKPNATAITFTFGLHPITRPSTSGGAGLCIYTVGTVVSGSNGAVVTNPVADSSNNAIGANFAIPADGWYALVCVTSATIATSAHTHLTCELQMRNA